MLKDATKWIVEDGRLLLRHGSDSFCPSAEEIFLCEFRGRENIRNLTVQSTPSGDLPDIEFERFRAELAVDITLFGDHSTRAHIDFVVKRNGNIYRLADFPDLDYVLTENIWLPLDPNEVEEIGRILHEFDISAPGPVPLGAAIGLASRYPDICTISQEPIQSCTNSSGAACAESLVAVNATLYPYQATGVKWLSDMANEGLGCILADEMGLGKTLQIIAVLTKFKSHGASLIVCPATLLENWRREIAKFAPSLDVLVHSGPCRTGFPDHLASHDIVISSYETLAKDLSIFEQTEWNFAILDEAQAIKNPYAKRSLATRGLKRKHSIAVTGTPVENKLRDLWALLDFTNVGMYGERAKFEASFTDRPEDAEMLESLVSPFILRRKVAEVADDLPPRMEISQAVPLDIDLEKRYENLREECAQKYIGNASLVSLVLLRRFCAHPSLVTKWQEKPEKFPKLARLLEITDEIAELGRKGLIFASFTKAIDIVEKTVAERTGVWAAHIDGRVPVSERQGIIDEFSHIDGAAFLVLNPKAAGTGLNITAANHVIHYTPEWNPAIEDQATARAHRRGQEKTVIVHRLYAADTVEEIMQERLDRKRIIADAAIVGTTGESIDNADIVRALLHAPNRKIGGDGE